jgi:glycerophosphoryl diester phosphodiesterase
MRTRFLAVFAAFLVLVAIVASGSRLADGADGARRKNIVVIAHRGAHKTVPENTLAALDKAIELGVDYVEIDVRRTKDGALVIMHDASVNRMTNGKGKIEDLTLAEIRKLDIVRGHKSGSVVYKIPMFDEILERAKGHMKVYVDHKKAPPSEVLALIEKHGMLNDVVVYNGSAATLREYKKLAPKVWIMPGHPRSIEGIEALARDFKPETMDGAIKEWTAAEVEAAHRAGCQVWVDNNGTLDNPAGIKQAVELGVDAIQTDNPEVVLNVLREMGLHAPLAIEGLGSALPPTK